VDVSLKGTSLEHDVDDMEAAYGEGTTPADVLQVGGRAAPDRAFWGRGWSVLMRRVGRGKGEVRAAKGGLAVGCARQPQ
jgi:hypothetical protein